MVRNSTRLCSYSVNLKLNRSAKLIRRQNRLPRFNIRVSIYIKPNRYNYSVQDYNKKGVRILYITDIHVLYYYISNGISPDKQF